MAQSFGEPILRRFSWRYTTICDVRREGLSKADIDDDRLVERIKSASELINQVTDHWFVPVESTERVSVVTTGGLPVVHLPNMVPILEVRALKLDSTGGLESAIGLTATADLINTYDTDAYRVDDRFVTLINSTIRTIANYQFSQRTKFPKGVNNVIIEGTFGQVQRRVFSDTGSRKFSTTTLEDLAEGATSCLIDDVSGIRKRDVLILRSGAAATTFGAHVIVTNVIDSPATVEFDPLEIMAGQTLPTGSNVVTYGAIPKAVEQACMLLVYRTRHGLLTDARAQEAARSRVVGERTDNYEVRFSALPSGRVGVTSETGDEEVDRLLNSVMVGRPPYIGAP